MGLWVWCVTYFEAAAPATKCKVLSFAQADKATKHSTGRTKEVTLTRVSKTKMGDMEGGERKRLLPQALKDVLIYPRKCDRFNDFVKDWLTRKL